MGLVHPHGIYAATSDEYLEFCLASAMVMKQHGIRMIGGVFEEPNIIECVRTKAVIMAREEHKIMVVRTKGKASELKRSIGFEGYLKKVAQGLTSPLFQLSWFDSSAPEPEENGNNETVVTHPTSTIQWSGVDRESKSDSLMDDEK